MVQSLGPKTLDRAAEIILAHFVLQQRRAMHDNPDSEYVDLDTLREYAEECAAGYRKCLKACKDFTDHEILLWTTLSKLDESSDEYLKALKLKKRK